MDLADAFLHDLESDEEDEEETEEVEPEKDSDAETVANTGQQGLKNDSAQRTHTQKAARDGHFGSEHSSGVQAMDTSTVADLMSGGSSGHRSLVQQTDAVNRRAIAVTTEQMENDTDGSSAVHMVDGLSSALDELAVFEKAGSRSRDDTVGALEDEPEYRLLVRCNGLGVEVCTAQTKCVQRVREEYAARFPELERLVPDPGEYVSLVRRSYNVDDISTLPLREMLAPATVIVVVTTAQRKLPELEPQAALRVRYYCDCYRWLEEARQRMLRFVEERMGLMAPNVSALCGKEVAARLVATAGGLRALSCMPSSSLQRLGSAHRTLSGLSSSQLGRESYLTAAQVVTSAPPSLRQRAARLLAGKCSLAARVDAYRESADGSVGERYREEIEETIRKLDAPPPPRQVKALPVPDEQRRRRRGGRRFRKQRERSAITELARQQSRMAFGVGGGDDAETSAAGLYGAAGGAAGGAGTGGTGMGRVRLAVRTDASSQLSQKRKRQLASQAGRSGTTTGLASSLAFTPVQGLELEDPSAAAARQRKVDEANSSYFSDAAGFNIATGAHGAGSTSALSAAASSKTSAEFAFKVPSKKARS